MASLEALRRQRLEAAEEVCRAVASAQSTSAGYLENATVAKLEVIEEALTEWQTIYRRVDQLERETNGGKS